MNVTLSSGSEADERAVRNLFTGYFLELAAWDPGLVMNDAGLATWAGFGLPGPRTHGESVRHNWWIRDRCVRQVIRDGKAAVGFAIVSHRPDHLSEAFDHEVVDFYVVPKARGAGAGRRAAELACAGHAGTWVLYTLAANVGAQAFWRAVLPSVAHTVEEREGGTEFRFTV